MKNLRRTVSGASALVFSLALVACSDPPGSELGERRSTQSRDRDDDDDDDDVLDAKQLQSARAPAGESGTAPQLECGKLDKNACTTCCKIAFPQMEVALKETFSQCICQKPGECASACGSSYCANKAPTQACAACVAQSKVCTPATMTVCQASAECTAYMTCLSTCS